MSTTRLIRDGEPVRQGVANRPLSDLQRQIDYLRSLITSLSAGRQIILPDAVLSTTAQVGHPVSWDPDNEHYRPAICAVSQESGYLRLGDIAKVVGVVRNKSTSTRGDITLFGADDINLLSSTGSALPADGDYYLSPLTAGLLTATQPSTAVRVLSVINGKVLIRPQAPDLLESHTHLSFDLVCKPAGTVTEPDPGDPHTISVANASLPGWLPAGHASFSGNAPDGAIWGYNLAQHTSLQGVWPPLDLASVDLVWNKGLDPEYQGMSIPLGADRGLVVVDKYGIWWMSDCYQDVPWPYDYDGTTPPVDDDLSECPRMVKMSLKLYFTRLRFSSDTAVVTSLRSIDTRLKVICADDPTLTTTVGSLLLDLELALTTLAGDTRGSLVLKELTEDGKFTRGRVLEGIYTTNSNVLLTSEETPINLVEDDEDSPLVYQGIVGIAVVPESLIELPAQYVRLSGAEDDIVQDIPFVSFPKGRASSIRVAFRVPDSALGSSTMKVKLRIFGRVAGTLPTMTATGRRIASSAIAAAIPTALADFSVTINTAQVLSSTNQYKDIESSPFAVAAGDTVLFSIGRPASDAYAGGMGFIAISGVLVNS